MRRTAFVLLFSLLIALASGCLSRQSQEELAEAYFELGNAYMELERWEDARLAYERALQAEPGMRRAAYNLSRALVEAGDLEAAERRLTKLLEEEPDNGILLETLGWVYVRQGRTRRAEEAYTRALEDRPHDSSLLFNLALLEEQRENWSAVYEYLMTIVELEKEDAEVFYHLGKAAAHLGEKEAAGWCARAVEAEPESALYREALAEAYADAGSAQKAAGQYAELAERFPERKGEYFYRRAYVLLTGAEDYAAGMKALESALDAGYTEPSALAELLGYPDLLDPEPIWKLLEEREIAEEVRRQLQQDSPEQESGS